MSAYQAVSCGKHSEYELLAMRQTHVRLTLIGDEATPRILDGKVLDVVTRNKAEYLLLAVAGEEPLFIRLDRIQRCHSL